MARTKKEVKFNKKVKVLHETTATTTTYDKQMSANSDDEAHFHEEPVVILFRHSVNLITYGIGLLIAILYFYHISTILENTTFFSHLSTQEREMGMRSESAFYFSFFKALVSNLKEPFHTAFYREILTSADAEFPLVINCINRFNLWWDVMLSVVYRGIMAIFSYFGMNNVECFMIDRGEALSPVQSCVGIGEPTIFYTNAVFLLQCVFIVSLYFLGVFCGRSVYGGLFVVLCYIINHSHSTRVMFTPVLRENHALPFFMARTLFMVYTLKARTPSNWLFLGNIILSVLSIIFWQFMQFVMLIDITCLFLLYQLNVITKYKAKIVLVIHWSSWLISWAFCCLNSMMLQTFYIPALLAFSHCVIHDYMGTLHTFVRSKMGILAAFTLRVGIAVQIFLCEIFFLKKCIAYVCDLLGVGGVDDDSHIFDIAKAKLTKYKFSTFHTEIYSCQPEFDFLPWDTWQYLLTTTFLLPLAAAGCFVLMMAYVLWYRKDSSHPLRGMPTVSLYLLGMTCAFGILAALFMRMKLLFCTFLAPLTAFLFNVDFYRPAGKISTGGEVRKTLIRNVTPKAILAVSIYTLLLSGVAKENIAAQHSNVGEYSNPALENLLSFVEAVLARDHADYKEYAAAKLAGNAGKERQAMLNLRRIPIFAGQLPTMAAIRLDSKDPRVPIMNHPHYENAEIRLRTEIVYRFYGHYSAFTVWNGIRSIARANPRYADKELVVYMVLHSQMCTPLPRNNVFSKRCLTFSHLYKFREEPIAGIDDLTEEQILTVSAKLPDELRPSRKYDAIEDFYTAQFSLRQTAFDYFNSTMAYPTKKDGRFPLQYPLRAPLCRLLLDSAVEKERKQSDESQFFTVLYHKDNNLVVRVNFL